jgi:hypothetical protein
MTLPDPEIIRKAWDRAGGKCECTATGHNHNSTRCNQPLIWHNMGKVGIGAWEAQNDSAKYMTNVDYCKIICWNCNNAKF